MREVTGYRNPLAGVYGGEGGGGRKPFSRLCTDIEHPRDQGIELLGGELLRYVLSDWGGGVRDDILLQ